MVSNIELIGWFSDLPHGRNGAPTLGQSVDSISPDDAALVADYLDDGTVIAVTTGAVLTDALDPTHPTIGPFITLSDGKYVWPADLSFYVRKYRVAVPSQLIQRAAEGVSAKLGHEEVDAVVDALSA